MKESIRRLVEALEQYAPRDRAITQDLITEARKLLEDDGWIRVEDAWQREMFSLINELHSAGLDGSRGRCRDAVLALNENVRTRPQQAGFVSVPVEPTPKIREIPMLTSDQLDEAARRLCRTRENREDGFSAEEARHQILWALEILDAIEYAKDLK